MNILRRGPVPMVVVPVVLQIRITMEVVMNSPRSSGQTTITRWPSRRQPPRPSPKRHHNHSQPRRWRRRSRNPNRVAGGRSAMGTRKTVRLIETLAMVVCIPVITVPGGQRMIVTAKEMVFSREKRQRLKRRKQLRRKP